MYVLVQCGHWNGLALSSSSSVLLGRGVAGGLVGVGVVWGGVSATEPGDDTGEVCPVVLFVGVAVVSVLGGVVSTGTMGT